jgi:hypothetical protein
MADIFKKNAASFIARFEYKIQLMIIVVVVAALFFFLVTTEEHRNFYGVIASLLFGYIFASFARVFLFSRLLLNKYTEEQLKQLWLKYGGFNPD